jgi:hypothetical protein
MSSQRIYKNYNDSAFSSLNTHNRNSHFKNNDTIENYQYRTYYVNIDSTDRNRALWPDSGNFEVRFQPSGDYQGATVNRAFKNVYSVELIDAIYPNIVGVSQNMYFLLCIPELTDGIGIYESTNNTTTKTLSKLVPSTVLGNFIQTIFQQPEVTRITFPTEGKRIDKLTIEMRTNTGSLFQFCGTNGSNDNGAIPNPLVQTSFTLRIVVRDKVIP